LSLIGGWDLGTSPVVVVAPLVLQGFGVGLFQVAYMDLVMGTLPLRHRGVAGSLAMLTRTLGVVSGATLLTLVFHGFEGSAVANGSEAADGFLSGFRTTFRRRRDLSRTPARSLAEFNDETHRRNGDCHLGVPLSRLRPIEVSAMRPAAAAPCAASS
jgi:hypothetical protein